MAAQDPEMNNHRDDPESFGEGRSNALLANTRCCFCLPLLPLAAVLRRRRRSGLVGANPVLRPKRQPLVGPRDQTLQKLREWSEIVAGPKWKTFIRRFNRSRSGGGGSVSGGGNRYGRFQYDPLSYSLNFDEGPGHNGNSEEDDYGGFRNFSTRCGAVSGPPPPQAVAIS